MKPSDALTRPMQQTPSPMASIKVRRCCGAHMHRLGQRSAKRRAPSVVRAANSGARALLVELLFLPVELYTCYVYVCVYV